MSAWQALGLIFAATLLAFGLYVAFVFLQHQAKKRWPDTVEVRPVVVQTAPETPPQTWWDDLHTLQSSFLTLQSEVRGELAAAQNEYRLAKRSEERTRKALAAQSELDELDLAAPPRSAQLMVPAQDGWEEEAPAPAGRQRSAMQQLLDKRRMQG